jgi:Glycosyl hydrolases family 43
MKTFFILLASCCVLCQPLVSAEPRGKTGPFVFAYFNTGKGESQGLQLAWSRDGYDWTKIEPPGGCFLKPEAGGKLMRDPSVVCGPDGTFHMVWTTGWGGQGADVGFGIAHSKDLLHWSEQKFVEAMRDYPGCANVWAPEITFDRETGMYLIYWASTVAGRFPETEGHGDAFSRDPVKGVKCNHRIYVTTTRDFEAYTPTKLFFNDGYSCIDAFIVRDAPRHRWVMAVKDEERWPVAKKNIRLAFAESPLGPWGKSSAPISPDWVEGPALLQVGEEWFLYYDAYTRHHYEGLRTADFEHWTPITDQLHMPGGIRHGTAFPVTEEILQGLLRAGAASPAKP